MRLLMAVSVCAALLGGCSGDAGGEEPDREGAGPRETTTVPVESSTTTLTETGEVRAAFEAYSLMMDRLVQSPNPDDPEIPQRASGNTLAGIIDHQRTIQTLGVTARFGDRQAMTILSAVITSPGTATVRECRVEDMTEVHQSGETLGPFLETYWTEYTLLEVDGVWRVDSSRAIERKEGEQPCV